MPTHAIPSAPGVLGHLTPGKRYPLVTDGLFKNRLTDKDVFSVRDDDGDEILCRWHNCYHLGGNGWTRDEAEQEDLAP